VARVSLLDRAAISLYALAFYLWKTVAPVNLAPLYELPERIDPLSWPYLAAAAVALAVSAAAIRLRRRWPALAAAWVAYVVTLLPVLGIVQNGFQIAADRYTYLASLGGALLIGGGLRRWLLAGGPRAIAEQRLVPAAAGATVVGLVLAALTWEQAQVWRDSLTLWTHALRASPSSLAHSNLGVLRARQGRRAEAVDHFQQALAIRPGDAELYTNLGAALAEQGRPAEAAEHFRRALALTPGSSPAHNNLGNALLQQGQVAEAIQHYENALRISPGDAEAHNNLGQALARQGRVAEAAGHFRRALTLRPDFRAAQSNLDRLQK
jgi:Flp pilus assembly protein TadD